MSVHCDLLIRCAGPSPREFMEEPAWRLLKSTSDCDGLVESATRHGLAALLCRHMLASAPPGASEEMVMRFRKYLLEQSLLNRIQLEKLLVILQAFEDAGIPSVPLKGPILSILVYDHVGMRQFEDLDILIRGEDRTRAGSIMESLGYSVREGADHISPDEILPRKRRHDNFVSPDGRTEVELHHELGYGSISGEFSADVLWKEIRWVQMEGRDIRTPSPGALLIYLCIHGSVHMWNRMGWVCDVDRLVRASPDEDVQWALRCAEHLRCSRMVALGLNLAHDMLGTPLRARDADNALGRTRGLRRLQSLAERSLFREGSRRYLEKMERWAYYLMAMDRRQDILALLSELSAAPTAREALLNLSLPMAFLHFAVRSGLRLTGTILRIMKRISGS